ncbi:MAG: IPTL-CTERM sorting domain-containing protein [Deltaproteobacteria bacterium]|nr:IPTL-CTERM sorting domain-containing protein [Deltaproteobacteria bacterium]
MSLRQGQGASPVCKNTSTDDNGCTGLHEYNLVINSATPEVIPTLSEWGLIIFMVLMLIMGFVFMYHMKRRKMSI